MDFGHLEDDLNNNTENPDVITDDSNAVQNGPNAGQYVSNDILVEVSSKMLLGLVRKTYAG